MTTQTTDQTGEKAHAGVDDLERRIIVATQGGLPIVPQPWHEIASRVDVPVDVLLERVQDMLARGVIRRIGAVPNHYAIGYTANGMSVWDVSDDQVDAVGEFTGQLERVTHCYRRPRSQPDWPYNLFAMVHGQDRDEVRAQIDAIAAQIEQRFGPVCRARDVLFSSAVLKKTGLRIA